MDLVPALCSLIPVSLSAAQSDDTKKKLGITHILSVCPEYASTGPNHLVIPVDDSEYDDLLIHLPDGCRFIEEALAHGGRLLIHCVMGISRSTTVCTCFHLVLFAPIDLLLVAAYRES